MSPADTPPLLAFIHGGSHHAGCWDDTIAALRSKRPTMRIMTVCMPGRLDQPGDLATLTIEHASRSAANRSPTPATTAKMW